LCEAKGYEEFNDGSPVDGLERDERPPRGERLPKVIEECFTDSCEPPVMEIVALPPTFQLRGDGKCESGNRERSEKECQPPLRRWWWCCSKIWRDRLSASILVGRITERLVAAGEERSNSRSYSRLSKYSTYEALSGQE